VALIGASESPQKYGYLLLKTLVDGGYTGAIHAVNPSGGGFPGLPFVRSLDEASSPIDVALVVRPAHECPGIVADVARRGIPFVIVYAAGFAEAGEAGRRLQQEMIAAARAGPTRLVGPNGMNIVSAPERLNLSAITPFPKGALGFLSASGNLGYALAHEAHAQGCGFSRFVSVGNQADLALDEYLDYFRFDPESRVVLVYAEGFVRGRARLFLDVLRRTAAEKPVLILRGGRTRPGRGAALSHTGTLAGEGEVTRQALEQAGAVLLDRADEALPVARAFLTSPLPEGPRVALVGEGGGHATLLTDAAAESGLVVEPLPDPIVRSLRPGLPPFVAIVSNPVEFGGMSEYDLCVYERVLGPILAWGGCDQALLFGGYALYDDALAEFLVRRRAETGKPILLHDLYADEDRPGLVRMRERGFPVYASAEVMARCAAALARGTRARLRARRMEEPPRPSPPLPGALRSALLEAAGRADRALLEDDAASLLTLFGIPTLPAALAKDADEAVQKAEGLGFPVVLKVHAAEIVHKSDVGGVHLDLRSPEDVRAAYARVRHLAPGGRGEVRLTPFRRGGIEALLGARRDEEFSEIVLVGAGGVLAESLGGSSIRTVPCHEAELREMVAETPLERLSSRVRGGGAVSLRPLEAALEAIAWLILSVPEVADVEVNPLLLSAEGAMALDARVLVRR
jgi:acyl-CoA synthetase (NDP forming)